MESVALYSFQTTAKDELPFKKGDTLKVWGARGSAAVAGWGAKGSAPAIMESDVAASGDRVGTQHGVMSLHLALVPVWGFPWGIRSYL